MSSQDQVHDSFDIHEDVFARFISSRITTVPTRRFFIHFIHGLKKNATGLTQELDNIRNLATDVVFPPFKFAIVIGNVHTKYEKATNPKEITIILSLVEMYCGNNCL